MARPLTRRERDMLAFERHVFPGGKGIKEALSRKLWPDLSSTRYYQLLVALIRRPEAEVAAPDVVRRLRSVRKGGPQLSRYDTAAARERRRAPAHQSDGMTSGSSSR